MVTQIPTGTANHVGEFMEGLQETLTLADPFSVERSVVEEAITSFSVVGTVVVMTPPLAGQ